MVPASQTSSPSVTCSACGLLQEANSLQCRRCGQHLPPISQIYRRQADGTWTLVKDIDVSLLTPKPIASPQKIAWLRRALVVLLVLGVGLALDVWSWRLYVAGQRREAEEIARYLKAPVGKIVPQLEARYHRSEEGELQIAGETNLPEGTALEVQIYAGEVLVAVDSPVVVKRGTFQTRPLRARGRPFSLPSYQARIRAAFDARSQPRLVLLVVGARGERLEGPGVHRATLTHPARFEFREDFRLAPLGSGLVP